MKAYIITLFDSADSRAAARVCFESGARHGYDVGYFEASTGETGSRLLRQEGIQPVTATGHGSRALLRHQRHWLQRPGTIGCYASHYRLWQQCVAFQESIVVFEHDALVLAPFPNIDWQDVLHMECEGSLVRRSAKWARGDQILTGTGVYRMGFRPVELPELVCMSCTHAYAIKPHAAQALLQDAKSTGWFCADRAMREPAVRIETHHPSLATTQPQLLHFSTTS